DFPKKRARKILEEFEDRFQVTLVRSEDAPAFLGVGKLVPQDFREFGGDLQAATPEFFNIVFLFFLLMFWQFLGRKLRRLLTRLLIFHRRLSRLWWFLFIHI